MRALLGLAPEPARPAVALQGAGSGHTGPAVALQGTGPPAAPPAKPPPTTSSIPPAAATAATAAATTTTTAAATTTTAAAAATTTSTLTRPPLAHVHFGHNSHELVVRLLSALMERPVSTRRQCVAHTFTAQVQVQRMGWRCACQLRSWVRSHRLCVKYTLCMCTNPMSS